MYTDRYVQKVSNAKIPIEINIGALKCNLNTYIKCNLSTF